MHEVAVGPLIGHVRQGLQIGNVAGSHICLQGGGEAEEELSMGRNRLRTGNMRRLRQLARQALLPIETSPGGASANTRHCEQAARLVALRPEKRVGACHDIGERVTAQ